MKINFVAKRIFGDRIQSVRELRDWLFGELLGCYRVALHERCVTPFVACAFCRDKIQLAASVVCRRATSLGIDADPRAEPGARVRVQALPRERTELAAWFVVADAGVAAHLADLASLTRHLHYGDRSERAGRKLLRQQRGEGRGARPRRIVGVDENHLHRRAEFAENLPASAAG